MIRCMLDNIQYICKCLLYSNDNWKVLFKSSIDWVGFQIRNNECFRERQIFSTSIRGLSRQKEYPKTGDMAPVVYSNVEGIIFHFVFFCHGKLFSTFMLSFHWLLIKLARSSQFVAAYVYRNLTSLQNM